MSRKWWFDEPHRLPSRVAANVRWRAVIKQKIHEIKLARGCADCRYNQHPAALDFDHRPGTKKKFSIGTRTTSLAKALEEIAKCDVVCANCHRIRTYNRWREDKP